MSLNSFAKERHGNEKKLLVLDQSKPVIPAWLIWIQCIAFVVLYAVWILPEIVGIRNTALVVGALAGLYPIYQFRELLLQKTAIPIWLMVGLFIWASLHLFFLSQDYGVQLLEFKRIWKYAAIGAIFAFGLGLSLGVDSSNKGSYPQVVKVTYWRIIFLGLCAPLLIYLIKYVLTGYGAKLDLHVPAYLQIYSSAQPYYVPKTDYVAFGLPPLAIALGQIQTLLDNNLRLTLRQYLQMFGYLTLIGATLFLFYIQDIKNGMAYAVICIGFFVLFMPLRISGGNWWKKTAIILVALSCLVVALYPHVQKNDSWRTLLADARVAWQTDLYQHWKYAGAQGYPNNEKGKMVSVTNYERVAWFKIGVGLAADTPLGYGLVEDSFKRMAKAKWPEVSANLSHSHSGWLDVVLAVGIPGFSLLLGALIMCIRQSRDIKNPWRSLVFWGLFSIGILWITTEVSATVTFAALIFWLCWSCALTLQVNCLKSLIKPVEN